MKDRKYIKKFWDEDVTLFYLCFEGEEAIKQIEITANDIIFLSKDHPVKGECFLYDQKLSDLELKEEDFISEKEFEEIWNQIEARKTKGTDMK